MNHAAFWLCLVLAGTPALAAERPIGLHPDNPHYFVYQSKPTVLITSGEHYGSVLNAHLDYATYLEELERYGLNLTRTFSGSYREVSVDPHGSTPLSPGRGPSHYVAPWALSDVEGGFDGRKYDLDRWNPAYFERLRNFLRQAGQRGVIVELVLFCRMYTDKNHWRVSPLHPDNNLQGSDWTGLPSGRFLTLDNASLVKRQKDLARKIVTELRDVPNVYFEIANEPASGPHDSDLAKAVHAWHEAIIAEIVAAESSLPPAARHLIAYNDHYETGRGIGPVPKPVSILNVHYLWKLEEALAQYGKGRALAMDETRWIAHPRLGEYGNTMTPASGRVEAWEFMLGGGAVYSNLNFAYQVKNPAGKHPVSDEFKRYLSKLKEFVQSFEFIRMRPDRDVIAGGLPEGSFSRAISEPGKQYGIYIHHSSYARGRNRYEVSGASHKIDLDLALPRGAYRVEWIRPSDLAVLGTQALTKHTGGKVRLAASPEYQADIALRIRSERSF